MTSLTCERAKQSNLGLVRTPFDEQELDLDGNAKRRRSRKQRTQARTPETSFGRISALIGGLLTWHWVER